MSGEKCVVEGCNLEYDVICSFSFYNVNTIEENDQLRQEWIDGAMNEESECLWRHVSLQLCGYHFELDSQGLWIDSPMLPELLTVQEPPPAMEPTAEQKKAAEIIRMEHNYNAVPAKVVPEPASRLNVRQLVDTLGYLSLKNLQRKQLWVVKVETDKAEASITQSEQVITKMQEPKQIIEIISQDRSTCSTSSDPNTTTASQVEPEPELEQSEHYQILDESTISDNFIYEIAEEQEITMDEVKEIPSDPQDWTVNILPDESKPKYAYIKHCNSGKKKRHFTAEMSEITLQGDFDNYYILPDVDPSVGVEVTTSYEPETYIVEDYQQLVLETPQKRTNEKRRKKKKIKTEVTDDWAIGEGISYDRDESDDYDPKKRKTKSTGKKYEAFFVN